MTKYSDAVKNVYEQLDKSVIIGLTGRTGSGCTTTAKILETEDFFHLDLATPKKKDFNNIEERKNAIIYKYMKSEWIPFTTIEVSSIILSFVFEHSYSEFKVFLTKLCQESTNSNFHIGGFGELLNKLSGIKSLFTEETYKITDQSILDNKDNEKLYNYYTIQIKKHKKAFFDLFNQFSCYESAKSNFEKRRENKAQLYTYLLQLFGNNIRSSGDPFVCDFDECSFNKVAKRVADVIRIIKAHDDNATKRTRVCIDAIRNPYEAYYLRDLLREFYLVSVNTEDKERIIRLKKLDQEQLATLDNMEYPNDFENGRIFYQQSIKECLQMADIHLYNPTTNNDTYEELTTNLIRYITLMLHPGLITPTSIERCMQVAYNAKLNSGCLSRQVGAAITDSEYYIKAIGWNEVPQGQISCGLRSIENYFSDKDDNTFSKFELENANFKTALKSIYSKYKDTDKYNLSYCFKDVYNAIKNDKNQVYTRSLHAEENAFLQASKFGGQGIRGGNLFVTASPCELCSKKAYQLGIKNIYYIDPYPGIAESHILTLDHKETNPKMHIFYGAIGNAYVSLYSQRISFKDELQLLTGVEPKKEAAQKKNDYIKTYRDNKYKSIHLELIFNSRTEVEFKQRAVVIPDKKPLKLLEKSLNWTGSSYDKTIRNKQDTSYEIIEGKIEDGKCNFSIKPNKEVPIGKEFEYDIITFVKDDQCIVNPLLAHHVKAITDNLTLVVKFKKAAFTQQPGKATMNLYADIDNNVVFDSKGIEFKEDDEFYYLEEHIEKPYLFYTYDLEWKFL